MTKKVFTIDTIRRDFLHINIDKRESKFSRNGSIKASYLLTGRAVVRTELYQCSHLTSMAET